MCIIIAKPAGVKLPPLQNISNSFLKNPDGFSCIWEENGKLKSYKTLDYDECIGFYKDVEKNYKKWSKKPMTLHFRLATHGSRCIDNCHAYIDEENNVGFQHNGILPYVIPKGMDITDSEYFFRNIFIPIFAKLGMCEHIIDNLTDGYNKFAFLNNGKIYLFGSFSKDNDVYYSNESYKSSTYMSYGSSKKIKYASKPRSINDINSVDYGIYDDDYAMKDYSSHLPCDTCTKMDCSACDAWRNL